jgi:hypothetical protein
MEEFAKVYVPLISALISLVSVSIAFMTVYYSRRDRRERQRAAQVDAVRREQESLLAALQGEKEAVGFMALQLAREPQLVTESNRPRLFSAMCLAFVFESSSRARALALKALRNFSRDSDARRVITEILDEVANDFRAYEAEIGKEELKKYLDRINSLKGSLSVKPGVPSDPKAQTAMEQIDTYSKYKQQVVEPDFREFMAARGDLRKAWHCAGSLFHLHEWVYAAHKATIDAKYTFVDDNGSTRPVSCAVHFANFLGQTYPDFQLVRGIANASKHFVLRAPPTGRSNPPGMPSHAANTYVSGAAFQPGAFSDAFQLGEVKQQADSTDVDFAVLAQSVFNMWNQLFAQEGW